MKIICLTHANFELPGIIEPWAIENGHEFAIKMSYKGDTLPSADNIDCLIVMGGPQDAGDWNKFPYLEGEAKLIKEVIDQNKTVIGFCLGAQLIGEALNAATERSPEKEVGVYPITFTKEGMEDQIFSGFSETIDAIHWHGDMPGMPKDAVLLAGSEGCPRQIIRFKPSVYGFQCHMEMTKKNIEGMIEACPDDLKPSKYVQNADDLLEKDYDAINANLVKILNRLIK